MERVFIALGSNLLEREKNIKSAIMLISENPSIKVIKESSLYETEPWGNIEQGDFLNSVIEVSTTLAPHELLTFLKETEKKLGRTEAPKWGPRIIDLDIVLYGERVIREVGLAIPHPSMHERAFVLVPLCEIAPGVTHPVLKKTISELLTGLKDAGEVKRLGK